MNAVCGMGNRIAVKIEMLNQRKGCWYIVQSYSEGLV